MMASKLSNIFAVFLTLTATSANADFWTATKLMQHLEEDQRGEAGYTVGAATGYLMGVADILGGIVICMPDGVTVKQLKQVVFNHMKARPETWNRPASEVVASGVKATWPCPK